MLETEDGLELLQVQRFAGSVQQTLVNLFQSRTLVEEEITTQLQLVAGEKILELGVLLIG